MPKHFITAIFIVVGIINFIPITGLLGATQLSEGYALGPLSQDITTLLQHRAMLFGIVGGIIMYAAFEPIYRPLATVIGFVSMISYMILFMTSGSDNENLYLIFTIDFIGMLLLIVAVLAEYRNRAQEN